ncbi:MAG TPA: lytic transglycosylase domain-containing protein [Pyrinomonadaceae bacterium]|nr:lytic transglycosylase domain-containing protein [Pyrinomonadaceae bacterium]
MFRYLIACLVIIVVVLGAGTYFFREYWEHRYDELIQRQARVYRIDEKLVWSVIYEETYFRAWIVGDDAEVGLMQVTPLVARDWANETGLREFERQANDNVNEFLVDPERNIQIGCWYLEKLRERYRERPAETAMTLAAYNAGPSRVEEWTSGVDATNITEADFIERISIQSTKSYVSSILERYRSQPKKK